MSPRFLTWTIERTELPSAEMGKLVREGLEFPSEHITVEVPVGHPCGDVR